MKFTTVAAIAVAASCTSAKHCRNITVPVKIEARNGVFDLKTLTPQNDIDVTNFILDLAQQGKNFTLASLKGVSIDRSRARISFPDIENSTKPSRAPTTCPPHIVLLITELQM
jgi:hypothetical protein